MIERRQTQRMKRLREARVAFNGRNSLMSGVLRDISQGGARFKVGEAFRLPVVLELQIGTGPYVAARRVWVTESEAGRRFEG